MYEMRPYARASAIVVAMGVAACLLMEIGVRAFLAQVSRIENRWHVEYENVVRPKPRSVGVGRLLIVGNSLLVEGVDIALLGASLRPAWRVDRFVVDDTTYYDWLYGLRRLFSEGAQYDAVVLVLTAQQLTSERFRGSYFARRLLLSRDVLNVVSDLDLHPTVSCEILLASLSEFYGTRVELRKVLLGRLVPSLPDLARRFVVYRKWVPNFGEVSSVAASRLRRLADEVESHHGDFTLVIPPLSRGSQTGWSRCGIAGWESGRGSGAATSVVGYFTKRVLS